MEAIAEMLAAILMGFVELLILPLRIAAGFLVLGMEFLFVSLLHGRTAAQERLHQRQADRSHRTELDASHESKPIVLTPEKQRKRLIRFGIVIIGLLGVAGFRWIRTQIRQQRIDRTKLQIAQLADNFIRQAGQPNVAFPEGVLPDQDAWGNPCELFVDEWMVGTLIVVRSAGPDYRRGTIDDMLSIRFARPGFKILGMKLGAIGVKAVQERLRDILPRNGEPPPLERVDIQIR